MRLAAGAKFASRRIFELNRCRGKGASIEQARENIDGFLLSRRLHGLNKVVSAEIAVAGIHRIEIQPQYIRYHFQLRHGNPGYVKARQKFCPQSQPLLRL
jgi:hypothetical protein